MGFTFSFVNVIVQFHYPTTTYKLMQTHLVSDALCPWLATSGESKLKIAFSSSSEFALHRKLLEIVGVEVDVGDAAEVGVVGKPGEDGKRLSRGRDPFVLILENEKKKKMLLI